MDDRLDAHLELAALSDEEFLRQAYRLVLRRDPEPAAFERKVSRATLLRELTASEEFERLRELDEAIGRALAGSEPARFLEASPSADERAIEIPWALSRIGDAERILDVGTANAEPAYVAALLDAPRRDLVAVDVAETDVPGLRSVVADVRELPFADDSFDLVLCVSTLEHVGRDNRVYGVKTGAEGGIDEALAELRRVLARRGRLVVTVPCGKREEHEWFLQDEPAGWNRRFLAAGFAVLAQEVYERRADGWRAAADAFDPTDVHYGERGAGASAVLCTELRSRPAWRRHLRPR